jgi:ADP-ribose pyrophosphatase
MPELLRRRLVFENKCFAIYADHIVDHGIEEPEFLVVEPRHRKPQDITGVIVVPVCEESILLIDHYRHPVAQRVIEVPRGFVDPGEDPATAALRELAEETGLICAPEDLVPLGTVFPEAGILAARVALFAATRCRAGERAPEPEMGMREGIWHSTNDVRSLLIDGKIVEASCCVALYRYFVYAEKLS